MVALEQQKQGREQKHTDSIHYKIGQRIKYWRLERRYTQEDLAKKIGLPKQQILRYEQGKDVIPLEGLYTTAEALSVYITALLPEPIEGEDSKAENDGLSSLIREYKKIESRELRYALIKSLFEGMRICKKKVNKKRI